MQLAVNGSNGLLVSLTICVTVTSPALHFTIIAIRTVRQFLIGNQGILMSSLTTSSHLLLLIIAVQQILNSPFHQTEFKLESQEGSRTVEDFISSVNGFELMKDSPNSTLHPVAGKGEGEDIGGEDSYKKKRKRRKRRRKLNSRNKNNIRVDQNDTVNLTRRKKIFVSPEEKGKIFQFISRVCSGTRSREVAKYCHQSLSRPPPPQPTLLSSIWSIFSH